MDTFRCPTCVTLLPDPYAKRCFACGQALYRRPPQVLGEEHRIGANLLPIDRWMLDRLQPERRRSLFGRNRDLPPVAWHGRFAPSARTPELEPACGADTLDDDSPQPPATVGALELDVFVQPPPASPGTGTHSGRRRTRSSIPKSPAWVDELYERARAELSGTD